MPGIKPCPLCDARGDIWRVASGYRPVCSDRDACGVEGAIRPTIEQALDLWNDRPGEDRAREQERERCAQIAEENAQGWENHEMRDDPNTEEGELDWANGGMHTAYLIRNQIREKLSPNDPAPGVDATKKEASDD